MASQGLGAAQDAARMQRVVSFYEKLPRGAAPEPSGGGLLARYQARYFGKNPSPARQSKSHNEPRLESIHQVLIKLRSSLPRHRCHPHTWLRKQLLLPSTYVTIDPICSDR